jgi:hypothetical protein
MAEMIPFRWPIAWKDASKLDLLSGTPINCLAGETPPPFTSADFPFVKLDPDHPPAGVTLREGVWPRVAPAVKKDGATAGPTGDAWVDSNAWVIRLAQLMEPGKTVWLTGQAPGGNEVIPLDSFIKPIAEAEAFGAHWVITLDKFFQDGLDQHNEAAVLTWRRMMAALKFFQGRREWRSWQPVASLAIVSTFEGDGKLMSEEFLNLAPRRHLAYRAMRLADGSALSFAGMKAVLYLEPEPPQGEIRTKLLEFAQGGGLLIAPPGTVDAPVAERKAEHRLCRVGTGRVAMPLDRWDDPFVLVAQVHVLVGHRDDVVRVWNAGSTDSYFVASKAAKKAVVHLIPYASGRTQPITLGFAEPFKSARLIRLDAEEPLKPAKGPLGMEVPVGEIADYAAVLLEL